VLELRDVSMAFSKPSGDPLQVLSGVKVCMWEGEILGLLGRSGSGKSTLLRIAGGLMQPTSGTVHYRDAPLTGPAEGIAIVFQTFALFPWLTVLQNVEVGLDALGLTRSAAHRRALSAIELIGLTGFESAYPREISGGMRQRVGFARAIVTEPTALLMDEPFSALDVLTAETLRTDFIDLWTGNQLSTKATLLVTHNIEEAVLLCDRVLVLASNPGRIAAEIPIALPRPRDRYDPGFQEIVDGIYSNITSRSLESVDTQRQAHGTVAQSLPRISPNRLNGFIERFFAPPLLGDAELPTIADAMALHVDDLFPTAEALHILGFAELTGRTLRLTAAGRVLAQGNIKERKRLFREHLLRFVPLAAHIHRILLERPDHRAPRMRFETELEDHLTSPDADHTLRAVTGWARYADLFGYDEKSRWFTVTDAGR
jgi:NitT/TauT family transport system ATP-binding protein